MEDKLDSARAAIEAIGPAAAGKRDHCNDNKVPGPQLQVNANGVKTFNKFGDTILSSKYSPDAW